MKNTIDKRLKALLKDLESQGWRLRNIKSGWLAVPPDPTKEAVTIHKTPSDHRVWQNQLSRLRNSGYESPKK